MSFQNVIKKLKSKIIGIPFIDVEWLRKHGAKVGQDVELIDLHCGSKDATCLEIGDHCTLSGVTIFTHDASLKRLLGNDCNKIGRVVIGNNVFIGKNAIILPGVSIGDNCVIGAGCVVTKSIPKGSIVAGNPAKIISTADEFIAKHKQKMEENPSLVYHNLQRDKMSKEELDCFNENISNKIVYAVKSQKT